MNYPLVADDTSGAATAINDDGLVVGISGTCDQAVGRHTARPPITPTSQSLAFLANPNPGYKVVKSVVLREFQGPNGRAIRDQPHPLAPHPDAGSK